MKKILFQIKTAGLVPVLSVILLVSAHAGLPDTSVFENSNRAYSEGKFDDAIQGYEELIQKKTLSSSILLNLGNAYYSKGDVGRAVLQYERALLMDPSDPDVQANLENVRKKAGLAAPPEPEWGRLFLFCSLNTWAWIGFTSLLILALSSLLNGLWLNFGKPGSSPQAVCRALFFCGIVLLLLSASGMLFQTSQLNRGVVVASEAPVKVSPFDTAANVSSLHGGETVQTLKRYGNFLYVESYSGSKGWISSSLVEPVLPSS
ncbi:MAG: tetratricopeptide repeat protein [Methylacidiphilales bacterium]|nr:tetratricopeptide repeat protein [Candidatus Methylacidiphilales bacterium]